MARQYPAGGTYRGQYGGYRQQPTRSQYESFFKPIPIEFLQEQLRGRQEKYDVAFAGSLAAKEQMIQQQAALGDLAAKNEIISGVMGNIDKTVNEKYGGDWGKASKEIASMVTSARQNPFWETTKQLSEQQKLQQKYQLENPNAFIYQDVLGQTAIDPQTGQVRGQEEITFRGEKRGDWLASVAKQFQGMTGDRLVSTLKSIGIEGYAGIKTVEELSNTDLQTLASNSSVVNSFLENNPDFERSKREIEGLSPEQIKAEAADFIMGNIAPREYKKEALQAVKDDAYLLRLKARATNAASGIVVGGAGPFENISVDDPNKGSRVLRQTKSQLDKMPDGPQKQALQAEYDRDINNREFLMHSVQNSSNAVDFSPYYKDYVKFAGDKAVSEEEFEERVFDAVREGTIPERDKEFSPAFGGGYNLNNAAKRAGREFNRAMKGFVDNEGQFAMNVNVLSGETGRKDVDTYVGRLNNELTDFWKRGNTGFTIPYSNQQIGTILKEDKRYKGKKKNTFPRDPSKDEVLMTDGTMDGKVVYQLNVYDKNGLLLGSEYVSPDNQTIAEGNTVNAAQELIQSGDPTKQRIGIQIMGNVTYGPAIQEADIYGNAEGSLGVADPQGGEIMFDKMPGQGTNFGIYTIVDGEKDYFRTAPGQTDYFGIPVDEQGIIRPTSEKEIQRLLVAMSMNQQQ